MPFLEDLLLDPQTLHLFIWNMIQQLVQPLMAPVAALIEQQVWSQFPVAILTPEQLADMVERGHVAHEWAAERAAKSGIDGQQFDLLVRNAGEPPGPLQLAEALRRGLIPESSGDDTKAGFIEGIAQSRLQTQWANVIKGLDIRWPEPGEVIASSVRSLLSEAEAREMYVQFGGDATFFDFQRNLAGEGPSPVEAGVLANRGIIQWDGTGPESTSFAQAVAESRFKNKWTEPFRALATYYPPPRTTVAMWREGSIDTPQATKQLLQYGVPQELIPSYLTQPKKQTLQTAHQATEGEISRLYQEQAITKDQATQLLKEHGYSDIDIPILLDYADLQVTLRKQQATITPIHRLYTHGRIDANAAMQLLSAAEVPDSRSTYLISIWELERSAGVKDLTVKEITDMWSAGLLTQEQATNKLLGIGYSPDDAALIIALYTPQDVVQQATAQVPAGGLPVTTRATPVSIT